MKIWKSALGAAVAITPVWLKAQESLPLEAPVDQVSIGQLVAQSTLKASARFKPKPDELYCYRYVKIGVKSALGVALSGGHAYQAAAQLAKSACFLEQTPASKRLDPSKVPTGAVVVWSPTEKNPSGHIFVSLGDGREVSDRIRAFTTQYGKGSTARVFLPQENCRQP
jgi:hypothetical protein